jgi:hypothetical protein
MKSGWQCERAVDTVEMVRTTTDKAKRARHITRGTKHNILPAKPVGAGDGAPNVEGVVDPNPPGVRVLC